MKQTQAGFTIVELLIVIVIIAILATISIVAFNGIQQRSRISALSSSLSQASRKVTTYQAENGSYPNDLASAGVTNGNNVSYSYSLTSNGYCITGLYASKNPYNISNESPLKEGPCDGQSGGTDYCPTNSFVAVNGYYCDGTEGSIASINTNAVKLSKSANEVPTNAPSEFVGRQTTRDNYIGSAFSVTPGEVYCVEGWAVTTDSTVSHAIGVYIAGSGQPNNWLSSGATTTPTSTWKKISSCITIPANYTSARFWSQNTGSSSAGGTATANWYQTSLKITKQ